VSPEYTVVLCTRNRAQLLPRALASLAALEHEPPSVELLVVDNGSSDDTPRILADFAASAPLATEVLHEPKPGLSTARNRALAVARGRRLLFTDDDQEVDPRWLREHARVADAHDAEAQLGTIALRFTGDRPHWLHGELAEVLGQTRNRPEGPSDLQLYGGNMLLNRDLLRRLGGFREDLGKGTVGYSEDTELTHRLAAEGIGIVFAPTAIVHHLIDDDRTHPGFFVKNSHDKGLSDSVIADRDKSLLGRLWRSGHELGREGIVGTLARARGDDHRWILAQSRIAYRLAWLGELMRRRRT